MSWLENEELDTPGEQSLVAVDMPSPHDLRRRDSFLLPTSTDFLRLQAERWRNTRGLIFRDRLCSYGALAEFAEQLAEALAGVGCGRGARLAFRASNSPLTVASYYAAWALGSTAAPLSVRATGEELLQALEHLDVHALILDPRSVMSLETLWRQLPIPVLEVREEPGGEIRIVHQRSAPANRPGPLRPRERIAVLAPTSGTTGRPKAVMLSHTNLFWSSLACASARGDNGTEVGAALSLLSHTPVFVSHVLCRILFGANVVLFPRFDLDELFWATERHGITDFTLIGGMVADVIERGRVPETVESRVRKLSVGGTFTPMEAKESLRSIFRHAEIIEAYGQSEATDGVTMARGNEVFERPGTVGRQNPHILVRVRRQDGNWAVAGEEGEIVVRGPTVMRGYWRDPQATRYALRSGWLHTGDLGRQDGEGFFYITGRIKNLIITGGENVSPIEVEEVLRKHPAVADVAVLGTPHPKWGEQVTAVVVRRPGANVDAKDLVDFAGQHLAGFKKPRRVEFVTSLPRNATNKVDLVALKRLLLPSKEPLSAHD